MLQNMPNNCNAQILREAESGMTEEFVQGSGAWISARLGSVGASRVSEVVATTKSGGYGASRANLMAELLCERLTGAPAERFVTAAMTRGTEKEPEARAAYAFMKDCDVRQVGLIRHPTISGAHASPDGFIGDDGILEVKCPGDAGHIDFLLTGKIQDRYVKQILWQLACTGRQWADYVSFNDRLPNEMSLFVSRVHRDQSAINVLEHEVRLFLKDLDERERLLRNKFLKDEL